MRSPTTLFFGRLLSDFADELHELLGTSWCACVHQAFDQHRVERALISSALSELFDLAIESVGRKSAPASSARWSMID
jgi:hypothetical protein